MHQCLHVPEVARCIANYLVKGDALSLAMTCRTLLEPGLDCVWHDISSFEPLIACLAADLLREERADLGNGGNQNMFSFVRDPGPADMKRYLEYYAPRIRTVKFSFSFGMKMFTIESLHGVQLATDCRPGALSPFLRNFTWFDQTDVEDFFGTDYTLQLSSHMSLFIGQGVEAFHAEVLPEYPLSHKVAVHSSIQRFEPTLKDLTLAGSDFIDRCLQSFTLGGVESLTLHHPSIASLPKLATLPRLSKLQIWRPIKGNSPPLETSRAASIFIPNPFPSLSSLLISSNTRDIRNVLPYLPLNKGLQSVEWSVPWPQISVHEYRHFIETLEAHSDVFFLNHLEIYGCTRFLPEEPVDMDPLKIELAPLFAFGALQTLVIDISHSVLITPSIISRIPNAWPHLRRLILSPSSSGSHPPRIDHIDVLSLLERLPKLSELGLHFDASCITGQEQTVGGPHKLRVLHVGKSPICSTTGVVTFLQSNFPRLALLDFQREGKSRRMSLFEKRWKAVLEGWNEARAQQ